MKLMRMEKYIKEYFEPSSQPDKRTVMSWIENNELPGKRIGKLYFVDIDQKPTSGNALADKILAEMGLHE